MNRVIIINAWKDLERVKVLDNRSNKLYFTDKMKNKSEDICIVNEFVVYVVVHNYFKDVVECSYPLLEFPFRRLTYLPVPII